ncbi:BofC C-terminal domain-containing protein [Paenibacillus mendelii]|uniref:BofC C-terminal domain-containing protein n=1 Tax=Paenibacillus mendelii TaxID=206163 RepID=A0ABV6JAA0_9BACL|nr:BofC C-terminal domain-containing protein [Paenibacillus mendelii]MCQ6560882.1 BofC C-terminal domain-containing protein [Paenibacillus mendelii]
MKEFSLWKQLKKRLRRGRRSVLTLGCLLGMLTLMMPHTALAANALQQSAHPVLLPALAKVNNLDRIEVNEPSRSVIAKLASQEGPFTVKLHRTYLCGEEWSALGSVDANTVIRMLRQHPEWMAMLDKDGTVTMEQKIDDLSEGCKRSAYFSVDKAGNLSLFDGPPKKEKVLRTFFQLDVQYMESSLPKERLEQLNNGIRVSDKDEYNSVLSTFSDYALDQSERVMKPTY